MLLLVGLFALLAGVGSAGAATGYTGRLSSAGQDTYTHRLTIQGIAYDASRPTAHVLLTIYADGH